MVDIIKVTKDHNEKYIDDIIRLSENLTVEINKQVGENFKKKIGEVSTPLTYDDIAKEGVMTYCLIIDNKPVSFLKIVKEGKYIDITCCYTEEEHRNKGYMKALFEKLFEHYNKENHYFILITYANGCSAINLYKKLGFSTHYHVMDL